MTTDDALGAEGRLISAALAGDGIAFRRLVEPHLRMLHRIAMRACSNQELARDAVQETLALSYQRLSSYQHNTPFKAYLAAVAARQAHTLARAERRRSKREEAAETPQRPVDPEAAFAAEDAARCVREALFAMPKKRQQAALLRLDAGLSYKEIAVALNSSEGSARVLVHTALKELRAHLRTQLGED